MMYILNFCLSKLHAAGKRRHIARLSTYFWIKLHAAERRPIRFLLIINITVDYYTRFARRGAKHVVVVVVPF